MSLLQYIIIRTEWELFYKQMQNSSGVKVHETSKDGDFYFKITKE